MPNACVARSLQHRRRLLATRGSKQFGVRERTPHLLRAAAKARHVRSSVSASSSTSVRSLARNDLHADL